MFLDNNKKIICLSVPKTGTTSCSKFFREKIEFKHGFYPKICHCNLQKLSSKNILKYDLNDYTIYGIVRCPIKRFLSGINHIISMDYEQYYSDKDISNYIKNQFKRFDELLKETEIFYKQSFWLKDKRVKIYRYENLDLFVKEVCGIYDIDYKQYLKFDRLNVGRYNITIDHLSGDVFDQVSEYYAEDQEMYDKTPVINT